ncbi:unnamed protein product [Dovyalis caffra]|uniref:Sey1/RHD3-like three-helix bundle domain-containing protein n=1 Tax=Dovyalis caffra TaxID=77055 RepID=A0AAV1RM18_9ROSI|nr:unnamed protein product [Dovyalis caffra]
MALQSLKILSVMAAVRLDNKEDNIEEVLFSSLMGKKSSKDRSTGASTDPLLQTHGKRQVSPNATLLTPVQCKSLWKQFIEETEHEVTQAISAQEAQRWIERRSSILWTVAENAGAAAVGTATGAALVVVGVAAGPAGAVGGAVGLMTAAAAAALK